MPLSHSLITMICKIIVFGLGTSCYCYPFVNGLIPHRRQGEGWGLIWPGATNSIWPSNYNANRIKRADQSFIISFILLRLWKKIEKIFFKFFSRRRLCLWLRPLAAIFFCLQQRGFEPLTSTDQPTRTQEHFISLFDVFYACVQLMAMPQLSCTKVWELKA